MAASTRINHCFSIASLAVLATTSISLLTAPTTSEIAHRASGRVSQDELAYRGSGRFSQGLELAYRGSERGIKTA